MLITLGLSSQATVEATQGIRPFSHARRKDKSNAATITTLWRRRRPHRWSWDGLLAAHSFLTHLAAAHATTLKTSSWAVFALALARSCWHWIETPRHTVFVKGPTSFLVEAATCVLEVGQDGFILRMLCQGFKGLVKPRLTFFQVIGVGVMGLSILCRAHPNHITLLRTATFRKLLSTGQKHLGWGCTWFLPFGIPLTQAVSAPHFSHGGHDILQFAGFSLSFHHSNVRGIQSQQLVDGKPPVDFGRNLIWTSDFSHGLLDVSEKGWMSLFVVIQAFTFSPVCISSLEVLLKSISQQLHLLLSPFFVQELQQVVYSVGMT